MRWLDLARLQLSLKFIHGASKNIFFRGNWSHSKRHHGLGHGMTGSARELFIARRRLGHDRGAHLGELVYHSCLLLLPTRCGHTLQERRCLLEHGGASGRPRLLLSIAHWWHVEQVVPMLAVHILLI